MGPLQAVEKVYNWYQVGRIERNRLHMEAEYFLLTVQTRDEGSQAYGRSPSSLVV